MSGQLGELVVSLAADIARFQADMGKAVKTAEGSAKEITSALNAIPDMFGKIGAAAGVVTAVLAGGKMFGDAIKTTQNVASEITKLTKVFGITAEEASSLRIAIDDSFLSIDEVVAASDRLTRASIKNGEAFKKLGIEVRDSDGSLKDSMTILQEVNDYLMTLSEGKERDSAAMSLYGKGWRELSGILRLTSEGMKEAEDRARELHLIFGADKIAMIKSYKMAIKDVDDIFESVQVQIGLGLLPELTKLSVSFGDAGVKAIPLFVSALEGVDTVLEMIQVSTVKTAAFIDKLVTKRWDPFGMVDPEVMKRNRQELANIDAAMNEQLEEIRRSHSASPTRRTAPEKPSGIAPDLTPSKDDSQLWATAHEKYLGYITAFYGKKNEITKQATALENELLKQSYDWGLIDQQTYLKTKLANTERELQSEIDLKQKEIDQYTKEVQKYTNDKTAKGAAAYHEALTKQTTAAKELIQLQGKLNLARSQGADESLKAEYGEISRMASLSAQLMDLTGQYEAAAEARAAFERQSPEYLRMSPEEQALRDQQNELAIAAASKRERDEAANRRFGIQDIQNNTFSPFGELDPYKQLENQRGKDSYQVQSRMEELDELSELNEQQLQEYSDLMDKQAAIDAKYAADKKRLDRANWEAGAQSMANSMEIIGNVLMQGNKKQFEIGKGMAIASASISMIQGAIQAYTSMTSIPYVGPALGAMAAAAVIAAGTARIAQIESMKYTPREMGGPVVAGQSYIVGEKRPELFTPGASGFITPYVPGGRGVGDVTQVFQISTGVTDTVRAEIMRMAPALTNMAVNAVRGAMSSGEFQGA